MRAQISEYCARLSQDRLLVQGAGGNVSWKDGEVLWIKASGTWLRDADKQDIFVPVALPELQTALRAGQFDAQPQTLGHGRLKPSIETALHALLPQQIVVHIHAVEPLSWLVRGDSADCVNQRMPSAFEFALVPYRKPGKELAQAVSDALEIRPNAKAVLLMNHGVVIAGKDLADVDATLKELLTALAAPILGDEAPPPVPNAIGLSDSRVLAPVADANLHRLATNSFLYQRLQNQWALYPDHVVFLGAKAFVYDSSTAAQEAAIAGDVSEELPIFIRNTGVFSLTPLPENKLEQLRCYQDVIERLEPEVNLRTLAAEDIAGLLNWDAERYRQQLAK